jgi:hypothetical protein
MLRLLSVTAVSLSLSLSLSLFACAAGGPDPQPNQQPSPSSTTSSSKDGTEPAKDGGSSGSDSAGSLGPQCTAYLDCCDEVASSQPALAGSCDQTRTSIEQAQEKGASTAQYESSCKQALASMKSAGYCK